MSVLLKFVLIIYILSLSISMFCALIRFLLDVRRWHDKEEKVHITPSQFEADLNEPETEEKNMEEEKEIEEDAREHRKYNSPIVF